MFIVMLKKERRAAMKSVMEKDETVIVFVDTDTIPEKEVIEDIERDMKGARDGCHNGY